MKQIDLRSDTVTKPTQAMLEAMFKAEVGDDVFGEDPTVIQLEKKVAEMFGMEDGLFVPSGTMSNQIAIHVHGKPGDEVICDHQSHIYLYESGGLAANSGIQVKLIQGDRGRIRAEQVRMSINADFDWLTRSSIVSIENTCNKAGGSVYKWEEIEKLSELAKEKNLKFHLDGARIFNALLVQGKTSKDYKGKFDSISICLSKGLGAPLGSVLIGCKEFIKEARRIRKRWGGGMRQAGYLAQAGIFALDNHLDRIYLDHLKAQKLASHLEGLSYVNQVLPAETNIVIFDLKELHSVPRFLDLLGASGIRAIQFGPHTIRMTTHLDLDDNDLEVCLDILSNLEKKSF